MCSKIKEKCEQFEKIFFNDFKNYTFTGRISFSSYMKFYFSSTNEITIELGKDAPLKNMQDDGSAFESYALAFISLYKEIGKEIKICIDIEEEINEKYADLYVKAVNIGHFNRFLYRLIKFKEQFADYVRLSEKFDYCFGRLYFMDEDGKETSYQSYKDFEALDKKMSAFGNDAKVNDVLPDDFLKFSEAQTEEYFYKHSNGLKARTGIEELNRQFPVGVFRKDVTTTNTIFVGRKAAIDLWGINKEKDIFCLFELKKLGAKQIGILSELFFYSNLIKDIYCDNKNYTREKNSDDKMERGYDCVQGLEGKIKEVHAYFLISTIHPLITNKTIELLNTGNQRIKYDVIQFNNRLEII